MKYAAPDSQGNKPYIVTMWDWGKVTEHLIWATDAQNARWEAEGRRTNGRYPVRCRRALPDEVPT